jgi:4'-phosphopantetheinyl transferase
MERLTKRFFTPTEGEAFLRLPAAERTAAFFRLWTRKEALLKATGQGIAHGLERFEVSCEPEGGLLAVEGDQARAALWTLRSWSPAEGYVAAVAVPQPGASLHCRKFEFD